MEHCLGQKINVNVVKTAHRKKKEYFLKTIVSQKKFASIGLRKKSVLKFPEFSIWKMIMKVTLIYIYVGIKKGPAPRK